MTNAAPLLGLPALQQALIDRLHTHGVKAAPSEVLITGGAQQGLGVIAAALISPGDTAPRHADCRTRLSLPRAALCET